MSSGAALAAAKKRRNVSFENNSTREMPNYSEETIEKETVTPNILLKKHDKQIFLIEKELSKLTDLTVNASTSQDNDASNKISVFNQQLHSYKLELDKQTKNVTNLTSQITTLRANHLNQTKEYNALKELCKNLQEKVTVLLTNNKADNVEDKVEDKVEDNVEEIQKGTITLDISDKK